MEQPPPAKEHAAWGTQARKPVGKSDRCPRQPHRRERDPRGPQARAPREHRVRATRRIRPSMPPVRISAFLRNPAAHITCSWRLRSIERHSHSKSLQKTRSIDLRYGQSDQGTGEKSLLMRGMLKPHPDPDAPWVHLPVRVTPGAPKERTMSRGKISQHFRKIRMSDADIHGNVRDISSTQPKIARTPHIDPFFCGRSDGLRPA